MSAKLLVSGRVTKVESNVTANGKQHAKITIVTDSSRKDETPNAKNYYIPEWTDVDAWNKTAEYVERNIGKGDTVEVEAEKITTKSEKDGKYYTNYHVKEIHRLVKGARDGEATAPKSAPTAAPADFNDEEIPF
jgi:single-stranded DNA-binding protein